MSDAAAWLCFGGRPAPALPRVRTGLVRLQGRTFADEAGPYLGIGVTLFPAVSLWKNDPNRLRAALAALSGRADYVRVIAVLGPGGSWADRTADPRDWWWDDAIAGVTDFAYDTYGLRVQWTVFGELVSQPTPADRQATVRRLAAALKGREHKVQLIEVANEGYHTGFEGAAGRQELRALGTLLRVLTPHLVALSAPAPSDTQVEIDDLYKGSAATVATYHTDRDINGTGGRWRPVRQAREGLNLFSVPWLNNEPIGRFSSVASEDDPLRLSMAAAMTWQCGGPGYVLHSGAGIRLGAPYDLNRGLPPTFDALDTATLEMMGRVRALLPVDLPNWQWANANRSFATAYPFSNAADLQDITDRGGLLRAFGMQQNGRVVAMPLLATGPTPFTARWPLALTVYDPATAQAIETRDIGAGETYSMAPRDAAIVIGTPR